MLDQIIKDKDRIYILTNAPSRYDWGWVRQEADNVARNETSVYRVVSIEKTDQYHLQHQINRYRSGLYVAFLLPEQMELWEGFRQDYDIQYTIDKAIFHHHTN